MSGQEQTREPIWARCGDTTPEDRRNQLRVLWALAVWAVCFVGGSLLIKRELVTPGPVGWLIALLPMVAGLFVLLAYGRFLRQADELQRLIQLQALALGFGGGWLAMTGYRLFERIGAPAAESGDYILVMALCYAVGSLLGWRRYR
jgi:hypothetical protein